MHEYQALNIMCQDLDGFRQVFSNIPARNEFHLNCILRIFITCYGTDAPKIILLIKKKLIEFKSRNFMKYTLLTIVRVLDTTKKYSKLFSKSLEHKV